MSGGNDRAHPTPDHHLSDLHSPRIGSPLVHSPPLIRIDRQVDRPNQNLPFVRFRNRRFDKLEISLLRHADRARRKLDLSIDVGHHDLPTFLPFSVYSARGRTTLPSGSVARKANVQPQ